MIENDFEVDYDSEEDILLFHKRKEKTKESLEVSEDLIIDLDSNGNIIGLELFEAYNFLNTLNPSIKKEMLIDLEKASLKMIKYRNYWIITLIFKYHGQTIEEKLPAFSTAAYESPLLKSIVQAS